MSGQVNTKFIANPSFGIQNVGKQTLTLGFMPCVRAAANNDDKYVGFNDISIPFMKAAFVSLLMTTNVIPDATLGMYPTAKKISLAPAMKLKVGQKVGDTTTRTDIDWPALGVLFDFLEQNPIHVTKLNVRASSIALLPSTMEVLTPNIFNGQYDRQVVNIVADTNMYQNQSNIVTLDCDFYITRSSVLRVDSSHSQLVTSQSPYSLDMDFTFDKYLSLEKALVENYELLTTQAGMAAAISEEVAAVNAKTNDVAGLQTMQVVARGPAVKVWTPVFGTPASRQPQTTKGYVSALVSVQPRYTRGENI